MCIVLLQKTYQRFHGGLDIGENTNTGCCIREVIQHVRAAEGCQPDGMINYQLLNECLLKGQEPKPMPCCGLYDGSYDDGAMLSGALNESL